MSRRASSLCALAAIVAAVLGSAILFVISRGKWSDAIIDSGREWIVPDALARGDLLYRDVVYWFGPFTPYCHAALFHLFGSSFQTLAFAGALAAAAILGCLYVALRVVAETAHAFFWTILALALLVFMPDAGGAVLGMGFRMWHAAGFGVLAATLAIRRPGDRWMEIGSGAAAAMAGLCRTEWGLAALLGAGLAMVLRSSDFVMARRALGRLASGFVLVFGGGIGYFLLRAGPAAVLLDAPTLLFNLPAETRSYVARPNPSAWARGSLQMAYAAAVWVAAFLVLEALARRRDESGFLRSRLPAVGLLLLVGGLCATLGGFPRDVLLAGAPLLCAVSLVLGMRTPRGPLAAALGGFGALGLLTSYRRPFFITDGPYVAPPLLFALVCAAACLSRALETREPATRRRLSIWILRAVGGLAGAVMAVRVAQYSADDRVLVAGSGGMLSARPETARQIDTVAQAVRSTTEPGDGLVVFPEGEILNFLSGRPNPLRHKLYLPGYVSRENEAEILSELIRSRPRAIVFWPRPTDEYGRAEFGVDYGVGIRDWIRQEYVERPIGSGSGRLPVLALRRSG